MTETTSSSTLELGALILTNNETLNAKVEYRDGLVFHFNYVSRTKLQSLYKECSYLKYDDKLKVRVPTVDPKLFSEAFCRLAVSGWSGATPERLSRLVPMDLTRLTADQRKQELPFNQASLLLLLSHAYDLDQFIQDTATDAKTFSPTAEEETKNS